MTAINGSSAKATQRRKRFAFFPFPDDGTKSLHQEQKTESGTISFLPLGQFIRTSGSGWGGKRRNCGPLLSAGMARRAEASLLELGARQPRCLASRRRRERDGHGDEPLGGR